MIRITPGYRQKNIVSAAAPKKLKEQSKADQDVEQKVDDQSGRSRQSQVQRQQKPQPQKDEFSFLNHLPSEEKAIEFEGTPEVIATKTAQQPANLKLLNRLKNKVKTTQKFAVKMSRKRFGNRSKQNVQNAKVLLAKAADILQNGQPTKGQVMVAITLYGMGVKLLGKADAVRGRLSSRRAVRIINSQIRRIDKKLSKHHSILGATYSTNPLVKQVKAARAELGAVRDGIKKGRLDPKKASQKLYQLVNKSSLAFYKFENADRFGKMVDAAKNTSQKQLESDPALKPMRDEILKLGNKYDELDQKGIQKLAQRYNDYHKYVLLTTRVKQHHIIQERFKKDPHFHDTIYSNSKLHKCYEKVKQLRNHLGSLSETESRDYDNSVRTLGNLIKGMDLQKLSGDRQVKESPVLSRQLKQLTEMAYGREDGKKFNSVYLQFQQRMVLLKSIN
ncbi:hypothetical protein ACFL52_03080, partial [Candidatus Margulisiibacteriota bacterium]